MSLIFSQKPGRRERQLLRKQNNPLFPNTPQLTPDRLLEAQRLDHEELVEFIGEFRGLVHNAISLKPNEESDIILRLKERLDKAYEQACGLPDDQTETKDAILKLLGVIMNAVEKGAGNDPVALDELEQEKTARQAHFELVEHNLVADLLYPDSPIAENELVPSLLSASDAAFEAALSLFDSDQLMLLAGNTEQFLKQTDGLNTPQQDAARQRLEAMQQLLKKSVAD
jgi:hypothetical protein